MRYSSACSLVGHERGPKARCRWCDKRMGGDEEALDDTMRSAYRADLFFWGTMAAAIAMCFVPGLVTML